MFGNNQSFFCHILGSRKVLIGATLKLILIYCTIPLPLLPGLPCKQILNSHFFCNAEKDLRTLILQRYCHELLTTFQGDNKHSRYSLKNSNISSLPNLYLFPHFVVVRWVAYNHTVYLSKHQTIFPSCTIFKPKMYLK